MKQFKYKAIFSSVIKPVVSEDKDKYLAKASIEQLKEFIPKVDPKNIDLLPFATDAYVVNQVNLNGAAVTAADAVATASFFVNKPTNLEHDRTKNVGVLLNYAFSEFGTNKPISPEDAAKMTGPYNVTVGGVIWRVVSEELANMLEDSNDKTSENYQKISASFEMGFDDFDIAVLPPGVRNLEKATLITDKEQVAALASKLKSFGGSGKDDNGNNLAIVIKGEIIPLGIALTENPAAAVKGVAVQEIETKDDKDEKKEENAEKISQLKNSNVIENKNIIIMKITNVKDITDEAIEKKVITAKSIEEFVQSEFEKFSENWNKEKSEKENALKASQEKYASLEKTHEAVMKDLETVKATLKKLEEEKAARESQETFNARMASFDEKFELTDEDRKVIASQIKALDEEAYKAMESNLNVLLKSKDKAAIAAAKKEAEEKATKLQTTASTATATTTEKQTVIDEVVTKTPEATATVPATTTPAPKSMKEKYAKAFSKENITIEL